MPFRSMTKIRSLLNMIKILQRLGLQILCSDIAYNFRNKAQFVSTFFFKFIYVVLRTHIAPETMANTEKEE